MCWPLPTLASASLPTNMMANRSEQTPFCIEGALLTVYFDALLLRSISALNIHIHIYTRGDNKLFGWMRSLPLVYHTVIALHQLGAYVQLMTL